MVIGSPVVAGGAALLGAGSRALSACSRDVAGKSAPPTNPFMEKPALAQRPTEGSRREYTQDGRIPGEKQQWFSANSQQKYRRTAEPPV